MAKELQSNYPGTQQELYSISDTVYLNLNNSLPAFAAYKSKYTPSFLDDLQARRMAAMNLPDEESRSSNPETLRLEMLNAGNQCLRNFQLLKGYIKDAFAEEHHAIQYKVAGQNKYAAASNNNWEELAGINQAMTSYMTNNLEVLKDKGYMPAAFAGTAQQACDLFNTIYTAYKGARQTGVNTSEKQKANNALYKDVMAICEDGQLLFAKEAEKKKLFVFSAIKQIVSPPGSASFKLTLKKLDENTPVAGARVCIQENGGQAIELFTDVNGVALFEHINPAVYKVKIEAEGIEVVDFVKEVNTGRASRKEVFV
ncbi:MAG: carboxypeptidase-like regulatory domain-containing protein [Daejeonella sp.]